MKKGFAAAVAACVMICSAMFGGCKKNGSTLEKDTLVVGYTIYAPMNYFDDSGKLIGFDTELAEETGKVLGKKIEFKEINWDNKIFALNSGEVDMVWNGMTITDELKEAMAISDPYMENKQVVVCQKGEKEKYKTKDDLKKAKEVLVESGSAGEAVAKGIEGVTLMTAGAQRDTLLEVKTSADKIAVIDLAMAQVLTGEGTSYTDLTFVDVGFESELFGIGFRKNDTELCARVNEAIASLKANGKFDALKKKYFA